MQAVPGSACGTMNAVRAEQRVCAWLVAPEVSREPLACDVPFWHITWKPFALALVPTTKHSRSGSLGDSTPCRTAVPPIPFLETNHDFTEENRDLPDPFAACQQRGAGARGHAAFPPVPAAAGNGAVQGHPALGQES